MHLRNTGGEPANLTISDNAYKAATVTRRIGAGEEVSFSLHLKRSHSWYDFTVKANGADAEARFAGRVEAGRPGFSDPLMGGVV